MDERESGFNRARRGDFGPNLQREVNRFVTKYPVSGALAFMSAAEADIVDGLPAPTKAPLPEDMARMLSDLRELGV